MIGKLGNAAFLSRVLLADKGCKGGAAGCRQSLGIERGCRALGQRRPSSPGCCCLGGLDIVLVLKLTADRLLVVLVDLGEGFRWNS